MTCHNSPKRPAPRASSGLALAVMAALSWNASRAPALAQDAASSNPPAQGPMTIPGDGGQRSDAARPAPVYSIEDLADLLAPIALYPDPLLALVLSASTFPVQVVEADRWIAENPAAVARRDFREVDAKPWDGSVQALVRFPEEIRMLAEHLEWSQSIGLAFSLQPADVMAAVQMLRAKAESVGNLKSTPEQVVTVREESGARVIYIAPANPERIYVPRYNPTTVFTSPLTGAIVFASGIVVGSLWNSRWGWNNRTWNQVWINQPVWNPPPPNWNPRPDRPGAGRPPAPWRPDRPGVRPERPDLRPDRPGATRPDRPDLRPDRPGTRPDRPGVLPERPNLRPDKPGATRPDRPDLRPDRPDTRPDRPGVSRPDRPTVKPDRPAAGRPPGASQRPADAKRPQNARPKPSARPQKPATRPAQPGARPQARPTQPQRARPQARPAQPQRARPQARPAQPQRARPAQQRARPQARPAQPQRARPQQRPARNR